MAVAKVKKRERSQYWSKCKANYWLKSKMAVRRTASDKRLASKKQEYTGVTNATEPQKATRR